MSTETEKAEEITLSLPTKIVSATAYIALVSGIAGLVVSLAGSSLEKAMAPAGMAQSERERVLLDFKKKLDEIEAKQVALQPSAKPPPPLSVLDARLKMIEQKQQRIEQTILSNPNKALELPLLRRDLEALEQRQSVEIEAVRRTVEQVYDLSKWLLGALSVGILSLAISTIFRRKEQ